MIVVIACHCNEFRDIKYSRYIFLKIFVGVAWRQWSVNRFFVRLCLSLHPFILGWMISVLGFAIKP